MGVWALGLCVASLLLLHWGGAAASQCASSYHVVEQISFAENKRDDTKAVSFSINGEWFSFADVRVSSLVGEEGKRREKEEDLSSSRRTSTSNTVCSLSRLGSALLAATTEDHDLRLQMDSNSAAFSGAILSNGEMKYLLTPARDVDESCIVNRQTVTGDLSDITLAYFPSEFVLPVSREEVVTNVRTLYNLEEGADNENVQMSVMYRSSAPAPASPFDYASKDVPPNCPSPVSISVGAVGQWSFRAKFASADEACSEMANLLNIASGIFEATVNVQLSLDFAMVMNAASDVGVNADEKWNAKPCVSTSNQLVSFAPWAGANVPTAVSQLFSACGDRSHIAYESIQCQSTSQGASVVNYNSSATALHDVAHTLGLNFGATYDQNGVTPTLMYEPTSKQTNMSLHFSRKSQLEMCSHLSTLRECLTPRDCSTSAVDGGCDIQCGSYTSYCGNGTVCNNGTCVVDQTCSPWCDSKGYNCGPNGCGGQCGSVDLVTTKALCDNGSLKPSPRNVLDVYGHAEFLVNAERSSYQVSAAEWDANLNELQLRNAAACDWNNIYWVGTVTGHLNIQAEFAVAMQPSSLYSLSSLISSDLFTTDWICSEDRCVSGHCERYRLYISEQVTGFSCYSQACPGSSNPFPDSDSDWSFILCGFVADFAINGHPFAPTPFEPPNLSQCYRTGNLSTDVPCVPYTCDNLQLQCGDSYDDGCGGVIDCGACPFGSTCSNEGQCECTPLVTCDNFPNQCGSIWDGCKYISCGCADSSVTCTATDYEPGYCICNTTVDCLGRECGTYINACGASVTCGICALNYTCNTNVGQCECTVSDCSQVSDYCFVSDGCGGDLYCPPPSLCNSTYNCGVYVDECGAERYCGDCSDGLLCVNNTCQCIPTQTCLNRDDTCGNFTDDCGVVQQCGVCGDGELCSFGIDGINSCVCDPAYFCGLEGASCGFVNSTCGYEDCGECDPGFFCNATTRTCDAVSTCTPIPGACDDVACGVVSDGCEFIVCENTCRVPSESCVSNSCVCDPLNACVGLQCGVVSDGCDDSNVTCGTCSEYAGNYVCTDAGTCVCTPLTCSGLLDGVYNDGCGGVLHCGGSDVPPCTPRDCASFGNPECGNFDDGCGNVLSCGSPCGEYEVCFGGVCECSPGTCDRFSAECSSIDDGCGNTIDCGSCASPYVCQSNKCVCSPIANVCNGRCGVVFDGCQYVDCAYCVEPYSCLFDQSASVTSCFNASCQFGQVWSTKSQSCQCPFGHSYDSVSEQCAVIVDADVDVCFSESWTIVTGRWLTQARESVSGDGYECSTLISAQELNNIEARADSAAGMWPLEVSPYMFANLDVRGEPATFTFSTSFEYDVRSTIFGVSSLIVDPTGTYVYFVWNANTGYWELGLTNVSGSRAGLVRPGFAAPVQRTTSSLSLQVYRTETPCALVTPYIGWAFLVTVGDESAGPYCFNEVPSHLMDTLFPPSSSLPFALLDDGNTLFVTPTYATVSQVSLTLWGCLDAENAQALIAASLSIPTSAVSIVSIEQAEFCPSPFGQKTDLVFQIYGGSYGTAAGLAATFIELFSSNLFPYSPHPLFPPTQSPGTPVTSFFQVAVNPVTFTYQADPLVDPDEVSPATFSAASSVSASIGLGVLGAALALRV